MSTVAISPRARVARAVAEVDGSGQGATAHRGEANQCRSAPAIMF